MGVGVTVELRVAAGPGETRVAALRDGVLIEYAIGRTGAPDGVGDVYRGRVTHVVRAMAGAFVTLGSTDGFLPESEGGKGLTEGSILPVRVIRAGQGGKGPRLSARDVTAPPGPVGLVTRGPDVVARLVAAFPGAAVITDDPGLRSRLGVPVMVEANVFPDPVLDAIEALGQPEIVLAAGARLAFHPTPALTAIDVDLGGMVAGGGGKTRTHLEVNAALIPALTRQIRLRNLGGAILVDFAGLPVRRRAELGPALAVALAEDRMRPRLLGFTALGLAEILRPRVYPPLHEVLADPLTHACAALRAAAADPMLMVLYASAAVIDALDRDWDGRIALEHHRGQGLLTKRVAGLADADWRLERHYV
jgi:Ribonuclease G/E